MERRCAARESEWLLGNAKAAKLRSSPSLSNSLKSSAELAGRGKSSAELAGRAFFLMRRQQTRGWSAAARRGNPSGCWGVRKQQSCGAAPA